MQSFLLLALVSALFSCVHSLPHEASRVAYKRGDLDLPTTNAERLRRGLPLKPPARRSTAAKARRSSSPPTELYGFVSVSSGGSQIGYLRCTVHCVLIPITESYDATSVRFTPNDLYGGGNPFSIEYDGGHLPNIGGHVFANGGDLGSNSNDAALLDSVAMDQPGAYPYSSNEEFTEGSIWTYTQSNGLLTPTWINAGDVSISTLIMAAPNGDLYLTGSESTFRSGYGATSSGPLTFHFPAQFTVPPRSVH